MEEHAKMNTLSITSLPPELLSSVFCELSAEDLARAATVCRQFYEASKIESVWQKRCLQGI